MAQIHGLFLKDIQYGGHGLSIEDRLKFLQSFVPLDDPWVKGELWCKNETDASSIKLLDWIFYGDFSESDFDDKKIMLKDVNPKLSLPDLDQEIMRLNGTRTDTYMTVKTKIRNATKKILLNLLYYQQEEEMAKAAFRDGLTAIIIWRCGNGKNMRVNPLKVREDLASKMSDYELVKHLQPFLDKFWSDYCRDNGIDPTNRKKDDPRPTMRLFRNGDSFDSGAHIEWSNIEIF